MIQDASQDMAGKNSLHTIWAIYNDQLLGSDCKGIPPKMALNDKLSRYDVFKTCLTQQKIRSTLCDEKAFSGGQEVFQ